MSEKNIVFDTNYLNLILNNKSKSDKILEEIKKQYSLSINIATFVEVVQQKINNKEKFYELVDFLIDNNVYIGDFRYNKCIEEKNFSFYNLKIDIKKDRKEYFYPIKNNYYNFLCRFVSLYLEWILYALMLLLSESLTENKEYKKYLNNKSIYFQKEFRKLYDQTKVKIKDRFNQIVYSELKKIKHFGFNINNELLEEAIVAFNGDEEHIMDIFHTDSKISKKTRQDFVEAFFQKEMKPLLDTRFNNIIFEEYIKTIFEKLIVRNGKLNPNDISDALILSSADNNYSIVTNDGNMQKFLKDKGFYNKAIYDKFAVLL